MFFELHGENTVGYKRLSEADLGARGSTRQTHIGLSESVFTFLPDREVIEGTVFIHEDKFEYIDAYFKRIQNPAGTFRSPAIRTGGRKYVSVVSKIREAARSHTSAVSWHLLWFGLKNENLVFFLLNSDSDDYKTIKGLGLNIDKKRAKFIGSSHPLFFPLVNYLEGRVNINGATILKELEVISQTLDTRADKRFKKYDVDRAAETFRAIGRAGEQMVADYLAKRVSDGLLADFTWHNEASESGLPYDFTVRDLHSNISNYDVKTTGYDFNQKMIFSSQEIGFISGTAQSYGIYRVYKDQNEVYYLRVCENCKALAAQIMPHTSAYADELGRLGVDLKTAKLAISPGTAPLTFGAEEKISSP